jgi:hypothetical protein
MTRSAVGDFLIRRLHEAGIAHLNVLIEPGLRSANLNFGPRGPQHRSGIGI